ncbi:hypothetical protein PPYR_15262, partial [Photinus pyralis]
ERNKVHHHIVSVPPFLWMDFPSMYVITLRNGTSGSLTSILEQLVYHDPDWSR